MIGSRLLVVCHFVVRVHLTLKKASCVDVPCVVVAELVLIRCRAVKSFEGVAIVLVCVPHGSSF